MMLSARKGATNARRSQQRSRLVPQFIFGAIAVCVVGLVWLMLMETQKLATPPADTPQTDLNTSKQVNGREQIRSGVRKDDIKTAEPPAAKKKVVENAAAASSVVCGGHSAPTCQECPQGHGEGWCHGDCVWCKEKEECMATTEFCPLCGTQAKTESTCNKQSECSWCGILNQCMHVDTVCPIERIWKAPEPEPWFTPPDPIDKYGKTLSVVLPCGCENEFFERTVRSVYAATPPEILHEIVVVDDNSIPPLEPMFTLDKDESKVKFVRSDVSLGLIDAKHQGAQAASGDIIVFFDCHVKPALGYWEPFVREIAENPKRVVVPTITALDVDTWVETGRPANGQGGMSKCYVTLDSDFKWTSDDTPWVPAMSGGLLAIGRDWFFQIGGHDQAMKGWGGENIDLSLRIWRCGGEIVAAPKSYVGHMWRTGQKANTRAKYKTPGGSSVINRARAFRAHAPDMFSNKTVTFDPFSRWKATGGSDLDVESIQTPMRDLQCQDFNWYLDFFSYIYRDAGYIPKEVFQLTADGGKTCLSLKSRGWGSGGTPNDILIVTECSTVSGLEATSGRQYWHNANRDSEGKCCGGLRAWNTDQCVMPGLRTTVCSLSGQPAQLTADGTLKVGSKCLSIDPLRETSCSDASKWEKLRPFEPQEFKVLSKELKDKW